ncbi:hypothetical protein ACW185_10015 [Limosilactobacillus fermentum]
MPLSVRYRKHPTIPVIRSTGGGPTSLGVATTRSDSQWLVLQLGHLVLGLLGGLVILFLIRFSSLGLGLFDLLFNRLGVLDRVLGGQASGRDAPIKSIALSGKERCGMY